MQVIFWRTHELYSDLEQFLGNCFLPVILLSTFHVDGDASLNVNETRGNRHLEQKNISFSFQLLNPFCFIFEKKKHFLVESRLLERNFSLSAQLRLIL